MLKSLKKILLKQTNFSDHEKSLNYELSLLCGIMLEAASVDGKIDQSEIDKIKSSLIKIFEEDPKEVEEVIINCMKNIDEPNSFHFYTSRINKSFDDEKKNLLLECLWEIVLSDGEIHDFESNLIRSLSGLMYIPDITCGKIKKKVLSKLNKF